MRASIVFIFISLLFILPAQARIQTQTPLHPTSSARWLAAGVRLGYRF